MASGQDLIFGQIGAAKIFCGKLSDNLNVKKVGRDKQISELEEQIAQMQLYCLYMLTVLIKILFAHKSEQSVSKSQKSSLNWPHQPTNCHNRFYLAMSSWNAHLQVQSCPTAQKSMAICLFKTCANTQFLAM